VVAVMAFGLAISLPNLETAIYGLKGTFDFDTCDGVVCGVAGTATLAGLRVGDHLQRGQMTTEDWYAVTSTKVPQPGQSVTLAARRGDRTYFFRQTARRDPGSSGAWLMVLAGKVAVVVLIVLASALFLVKPSSISSALALFAAGEFAVNPSFYSFLPGWAFVWLTVLTYGLFNAAGVTGFLWLALTLGRDSQRDFPRILLFLFAVMSLGGIILYVTYLWAAPDTLAGFYWIVTACCLAPGVPLLMQTARRKNALQSERLACALLVVAGSAKIANLFLNGVATLASLHHVSAIALMADDPANRLRESLHIIALAFAAAAAYVIARDRVVDTGLVFSRILSYGSTSLAILLALGFLNWALSPRLSAYPFAIPLEVIGAVAIGYWFSGLRDVSTALSLAAVDAPSAAMHGNPEGEYRALDRALGLAERTRQRGLIAEIHARCAFSAWVNCDDAAFERHVHALISELGSRSLRGLRTFARAASPGASEDPPKTAELPEWHARSSLLLSAGCDSANEARAHAIDAVSAADTDGSPWLRALARVALAELSPGDRERPLNEAREIALRNRANALAESLKALRADSRACGFLQAFVEVRLRKVRQACPALEVEFCSGDVRVLGKPVEFPEKERALLFTVAASKTIRPEPLTDALWPESDGDVALNALKACLHRLRRRTGDPRIIRRVGRAYALHPGADVDLWRLDVALSEGQTEEIAAIRESFCRGAQRRATLGSWFTPFETLIARRLEEVERRAVSK
jgi:hypothetical protein